MVMTPWGNASTLHERRLAPGRGTPREVARRNQRERLFAAMVAVASTKGYRATSVADLVEISGVSSRSFYQHFADKEECFLATLDEIVAITRRQVAEGPLDVDGPEQGVVAVGRALAQMLAHQPYAARLLLVEAFSAGEEARGRMHEVEKRTGELLQAAFEQTPGRQGMPPELTRALLGGVAGVVARRLARDEIEGIEELASALGRWVLSVPPPPRPLRSPTRRNRAAASEAPPFAAHLSGERILRAFAAVVAEKGYAGTKVSDVVARASISQATFYAHFRDKEDAFNAALDSSGAQLVAATLPAVRRAPPWPAALRVALEAIFGFLAAEPAFAHLRSVEVYGLGLEAVQLRDRHEAEIVSVLCSLPAEAPTGIEPVPLEATLAAIHALLFLWVREQGVERLGELVPFATYLALAPLLGAEEAWEVACG